jgi:hypothetical protein
MANLVQTAANVQPSATTVIDRSYNAGVAIVAGNLLYYDAAANNLKLADANLSSTTSTLYGMALNNAAVGQPVAVAQSGVVNVGATTVKGNVLIVSATDSSGAIAPVADAVSGWFMSVLGVANDTAGNVQLKIFNSGISV